MGICSRLSHTAKTTNTLGCSSVPRSRQKLKASRSSVFQRLSIFASRISAFPPAIVKSRSIFSYLRRALHPPIMIPRNRQSLICVSIASFFFFLRFSIRAASVLLPTWKSRRTVKRVVGAYVDFSFLPLIELRAIIYPVMLDTKISRRPNCCLWLRCEFRWIKIVKKQKTGCWSSWMMILILRRAKLILR